MGLFSYPFDAFADCSAVSAQMFAFLEDDISWTKCYVAGKYCNLLLCKTSRFVILDVTFKTGPAAFPSLPVFLQTKWTHTDQWSHSGAHLIPLNWGLDSLPWKLTAGFPVTFTCVAQVFQISISVFRKIFT